MVTRLQTDGEYKITTLLLYLFQTIGSETISNHMHRTGSHQIQIPTHKAKKSRYQKKGMTNYRKKEGDLASNTCICHADSTPTPYSVSLSQTSFSHISINSSTILMVLKAMESPQKDLSINASHVSRQSILAEILSRSTGNNYVTVY